MSEITDTPTSLPCAPGRSRTIRIAHITTAHPADDARILYRETASLKQLGFDVCVAGPYDHPAVLEGVPILALRKSPNRIWRMLTATFSGLKAALASRARLLHFHDPELLPAAIIAKLFLGKRVVFDAHEDVALLLLKPYLPNWLKRPLLAIMKAVDRFCARRVDAVVVPTRLLNDKYLGISQRVETFVNFPASAFLRQRDRYWRRFDQRSNEVVHLGTLRISRLEFIVNVARRFLESHPDWTWSIIGMHPPMLRWFDHNVTGPIRQRLSGEGKISHLEVADRLCQAKIGINYHLLASRQIQVAIPLKVFEYLACGLCAVSTRVPLLAELVSSCPAVSLCGEDAESYVAAVNALADRNDLAELAQVAREYNDRQFSCRGEAQRLASMYEDILCPRGK